MSQRLIRVRLGPTRTRRPLGQFAASAIALVFSASVLAASVLTAQDNRARRVGNVPRDVAREAVTLFNAPATKRVRGDWTLTPTDTVRGDVAVLNGRARIEGVITGQLVVLNGDAVLAGSGRIDRSLTVIGGTFESPERPTIGGDIRVWSARLQYREEADTLVTETGGELFAKWSRWQRDDPNGTESDLFLTTAHTYNRVEGLPIYLGPRMRIRNGDTRVIGEIFGIFRTGNQLEWKQENLGYRVRGEIRQGNAAGLFVGGRLFDEVDAVERWQLSDTEIGLSSFLFTRDYRDYWLRHGAQGYVGMFGPANTEVRATFGEERWSTRRARNVPSLFNDDVPWRINPAADEGVVRLLTLAGKLDTRNRIDNPRSGWLLQVEFERGELTGEVPITGGPVVVDATNQQNYQRAFLDFRRYNRLGPGAQLNLRAVLGGWAGGDALPAQRRVSLSGLDELPGFAFRRMVGTEDTGTCASGPEDAYIALGRPALCDRIALVQAEWKGDFRVAPFGDKDELGDRRWSAGRFRADGAWVVFANAGRGWLVDNPGSPLNYGTSAIPPVGTWRTDVGGGFDFGSIGVYVAKSLSESSLPANVYVRLNRRF